MSKRFASGKLRQRYGFFFPLTILIILVTSSSYSNSNFKDTENPTFSNHIELSNFIYGDEDDLTKTKCVCEVDCPKDPQCKCCASTESPKCFVSGKTELDKRSVLSNDLKKSDKSESEPENNDSIKDNYKDFPQ